jgi:hypothetical protein
MADVSGKLVQALKMIENGKYFIINRPRQYGKTTTLYTLSDMLRNSGNYIVLNTSFEGVGDLMFSEEARFATDLIRQWAKYASAYAPDWTEWLLEQSPKTTSLSQVADVITQMVIKTDKMVVLMIDEVDKSSNNQLFISFLAMLRNKYLEQNIFKTFHSIVLAGVHDVKSLKLKIRPDQEEKYNSPWNIAAEFKVDMNLQPFEIKPMLDDYVAERGVKMDTAAMAEDLFYYTSGYPFLVSKLCKMMDEDVLPTKEVKEWTEQDLEWTVKQLIKEKNANFDSMIKNLENNQILYDLVREVAVDSENISFNAHQSVHELGVLYGIFVSKNNRLFIHNKIYNEVIVNYMIANMSMIQLKRGSDFGSGYLKPDNKSLNMEVVLRKFQTFMHEQYSKQDRDFLERQGRLVFLAFIKPILNGHGHDFKEVQISDEKRLDVTITFYQHKYVAELKIWRGQAAHEEGLAQLNDYLDRLHLTEGYLLIFDHKEVKTWHSEWIEYNGKKIFIVWV